MKIVLALDTSSSITSCAVRKADGAVICEERNNRIAAQPHNTRPLRNEELESLLQGCFTRAGVTADQVNTLLIGEGPGSFTGLRIGFSFIKGVSFACRRVLYPVSSLAAYAFAGGAADRSRSAVVAALSDARRGQVFSGVFSRRISVELARAAAERIQTISELAEAVVAERLMHDPPARVRAVSDDGDLLESFKNECLRRGVPAAEISLQIPQSIAVGLIEAFLQGCGGGSNEFSVASLAAVSPNYLRSVAAKTIAERRAEKGA